MGFLIFMFLLLLLNFVLFGVWVGIFGGFVVCLFVGFYFWVGDGIFVSAI